MAADTLNCPMCGAPAAADSTRCEHCGAGLATVACPSCFGMVFAGAKFCSHCGAKIDRTETPAAAIQLCPRCRLPMNSVAIGKTNLHECPGCEGIWADADSLRQICADRENQAAVLGMAESFAVAEAGDVEQRIRYIQCPVCGNLMNRVNFAHCSHIVVDVCARHGTWFDKDELQRIVEFIRAGGLEKERAREISELEEQRRQRTAGQIADAWKSANQSGQWEGGDLHTAVSAVATVLRALLGE